MRVFRILMIICLLFVSGLQTVPAHAESQAADLERSMSDTLDLWRDGRYEQLFERLAHRGKTSRESFVTRMKAAGIRPACCFQKMEGFKVLNEKRTEATVYVKIGLEGSPGTADACTREFKLSHEEGIWKMQLQDIFNLGGVGAKKGRHSLKKAKKAASPYHN